MKTRILVAFSLGTVLVCAAATPQPVEPLSGTTTNIKVLKEPPYYSGKAPTSLDRVAVLAVRPIAANPDLPADWVPTEELVRLAEEMTRALPEEASALGAEIRPGLEGLGAPRVYFGCSYDESDGSCLLEERANVLATSSATKAWRKALGEQTTASGFDHAVVIDLGIAPQWIHQKNLRGAKEIRLGTDSTQPLPWLSSLETPVWVIQVRGILVDAEGRIVRSGAEGIWALRTPFKASILETQRILSPADVDSVRSELRREDLPGAPLAWRVALGQLLQQLAGLPPADAAALDALVRQD